MEGAAALTKIWYLRNLPIFERLGKEHHRLIGEAAIMRTVSKGERLYEQGSSDPNVYILKRGTLKITQLTPDGKEIILDILKSGSLFGELVAGEPGEHDESAVMLEDGLICTIPSHRFQELLQTIPGLALQITKLIRFRLRKIENRLVDLVHCTVEQRLAKTLLNVLDDFGVPSNQGILITVRLTHKDLARLIASTRETVTATVNRFKRKGILTSHGKHLVVRDLDKLKELAS